MYNFIDINNSKSILKIKYQQRHIAKPTIQKKSNLSIGEPNDQYEKEADQVAAKVMRMPSDSPPVLPRNGESKYEGIHRKCAECEEETLQRKGQGSIPEVQPDFENKLHSSKSGGRTMSPPTSQFMGSRMGHDFSNVKIHTGDTAEKMNRSISAKAFTHGKNIYFNRSQYNPESDSGKKLLAHELTHVVQQTGAMHRKPLPSTIQRADEETENLSVEMRNSVDSTRFNFAFIMGTEGAFKMAAYYAETYYSGTHKVKHATSLCDLMSKIQNSVDFKDATETRDKIGQVVIVTHANQDGTFFFPLTDGGTEWVTADDISTILSNKADWAEVIGAGCKGAIRIVGQKADSETKVEIKGCNIGKNEAAIDAMRELFGGSATVMAYKKTVQMKGLGYGNKGDKGRANEIEVIKFMVDNGFMPKKTLEWDSDKKMSFVQGLIWDAKAKIGGIPSDFLVLDNGKAVLPSTAEYQENIAISAPTPEPAEVPTSTTTEQPGTDTSTIQRQCEDCEVEDLIQPMRVQENTIQRALAYGGGYKGYNTPAKEIAAVGRKTWNPATRDFKVNVDRSGGGTAVNDLAELIKFIKSQGKGSITRLGVIGHSNEKAFGFKGTIDDTGVVLGGAITKDALKTNEADIQAVKDRFASGAKLTLYSCNSGGIGGTMVKDISNAFGVCTEGFSDYVEWCITWDTSSKAITSRGNVWYTTMDTDDPLYGLESRPDCTDFFKKVTDLKPDKSFCPPKASEKSDTAPLLPLSPELSNNALIPYFFQQGIQLSREDQLIQRSPYPGSTESLHNDLSQQYENETGDVSLGAAQYSEGYRNWLEKETPKIEWLQPIEQPVNPLERLRQRKSTGETFAIINGMEVDGKDVSELWQKMVNQIKPTKVVSSPGLIEGQSTFKFDPTFEIRFGTRMIIASPPGPKGWKAKLPGTVFPPEALACRGKTNIPTTLRGDGGDNVFEKLVRDSELEHVAEIKDLYNRHIVSYFNFVTNLQVTAGTEAEGRRLLIARLGKRVDQAALGFAFGDIAATKRFDDPLSTHHGDFQTTPDATCSSVEIIAGQKNPQKPGREPGNVQIIAPVVQAIDPANLSVSGTQLLSGTTLVKNFSTRDNALAALGLMTTHGIDELHTIGPFTMAFEKGAVPILNVAGISKISIDPSLAQVSIGFPNVADWVLSQINGDQITVITNFGANRDEAYSAIKHLRLHQFTKMVYIGDFESREFSYFMK